MSDRRSLTATLTDLPNIDPAAARAFVTQEPKPPVTPEPPTAVPRVNRPDPGRARPGPAEPSRKSGKKVKPHGVTPVGLIPVTVRLRPEIAGALKRASLERQLGGEEPYTQQDLVEQLLEPWLRENGFLA